MGAAHVLSYVGGSNANTTNFAFLSRNRTIDLGRRRIEKIMTMTRPLAQAKSYSDHLNPRTIKQDPKTPSIFRVCRVRRRGV